MSSLPPVVGPDTTGFFIVPPCPRGLMCPCLSSSLKADAQKRGPARSSSWTKNSRMLSSELEKTKQLRESLGCLGTRWIDKHPSLQSVCYVPRLLSKDDLWYDTAGRVYKVRGVGGDRCKHLPVAGTKQYVSLNCLIWYK